MSQRPIIVGLGNPGGEYEWTRHNFGFLVVQRLAERAKLKFVHRPALNGMVAEGQVTGCDCVLVLPLTYMNKSGINVQKIWAQAKGSLEDLLIVCDDFRLDLGVLRLRTQGSHGGHNGLKSVEEALGTREYPRLRCGVGAAGGKDRHVEHVLGTFNKEEQKHLGEYIDRAADCCETWLTHGITAAMDQFNKRKNDE